MASKWKRWSLGGEQDMLQVRTSVFEVTQGDDFFAAGFEISDGYKMVEVGMIGGTVGASELRGLKEVKQLHSILGDWIKDVEQAWKACNKRATALKGKGGKK